MYLRYIAVVTCLILSAVPLYADAAPVIRSGDTVTVAADQKVSGDFYAAGGNVSTSGSIDGDFYGAGGTLVINGPVAEDVVLAAGSVSIHAPVGDDVRIAGGQVTIASEVAGDLIVFAGSLSILSTADIKGDVLFYGGKAEISGHVGGSIHTYAESLRIDSTVGGDITATISDNFSLSPIANVEGGIAYKSNTDINRAPGSVVVGEVTKARLIDPVATESAGTFPVFNLLATLFAALVALLLLGGKVERLIGTVSQSFGVNVLIGFGVVILMPIAAVLLMISVLGMFIGVPLLILYLLLIIVSWIVSGIMCGALIAKAFTKKYKVTWSFIILGTITLHLLLMIPIIGPLAVMVIYLAVAGGVASALYRHVR